MAHDIFISYSKRDKNVANALCATLESRKIRCWIAPRDVEIGMDYPAALIQALNNSRILVLVFSNGANKSGQVIREVERAVSKGIIIIPFRIEDVEPTGSMEFLLSIPHWLDAITPPLEKHLEKLADKIQGLLANKEENPPLALLQKEKDETATKKLPQPSIKKTKLKGKPMRILAAVAVVAIIILSAFFLSGWFFGPNKPVSTPTPSASATATPFTSATMPTATPTGILSPSPVNSSNNENLDFTPKGVATIELIDGSKYSVPGNSLAFVNNYDMTAQGFDSMIQGFPSSKEILLFENMKSFRFTNDSIIITLQNDQNVTHAKPYNFDLDIGLASNGALNWAEVKQVTFNHSADWQQPFSMATITPNHGDSFKVPAEAIIAQIYGSFSYDWKLGLDTDLGNFVPFKEIIRVEYIGWNTTGDYRYQVKLTTTEGGPFEVTLSVTYFWSLNRLGAFQTIVANLKSIDFDWRF